MVKNLPSSAGNSRDMGSIPESGRSSGIGNGNLLQYSCLGNPMDRRIWQATVHGVTKSQTQWSMHTYTVLLSFRLGSIKNIVSKNYK